MKEDIYDSEAYQACIERINHITPETQAKWGKMDAAQMMAHCAEIQEVMNGKSIKVPFIFKIIGPFVKKAVLKGNYQKNLSTVPAYRQKDPKNFEEEKQRLLKNLEIFFKMDPEKAAALKHPFFGKMTAQEKGRSIYLHLDHHLQQFGV